MTDTMGAVAYQETVIIPARAALHGELTIPPHPRGIVLFAHGSGSSRFSPRNKYVAEALREAGFATLLFDLLTADEERVDERTGTLRFDVSLLGERLIRVTDWLDTRSDTRSLHVGYFGASTGAAAALIAASARPGKVHAVVSRGGRPDLAAPALGRVIAPTLLIVGGLDTDVIALNRWALEMLVEVATRRIEIVPGATHLFPEPGALDQVCALACAWFEQHLGTTTTT